MNRWQRKCLKILCLSKASKLNCMQAPKNNGSSWKYCLDIGAYLQFATGYSSEAEQLKWQLYPWHGCQKQKQGVKKVTSGFQSVDFLDQTHLNCQDSFIFPYSLTAINGVKWCRIVTKIHFTHNLYFSEIFQYTETCGIRCI